MPCSGCPVRQRLRTSSAKIAYPLLESAIQPLRETVDNATDLPYRYPILTLKLLTEAPDIDSEHAPGAPEVTQPYLGRVDARDGVHNVVGFINNDYVTLKFDAQRIPCALLKKKGIWKSDDLGGGYGSPGCIVRTDGQLLSDPEEVLDVWQHSQRRVAQLVGVFKIFVFGNEGTALRGLGPLELAAAVVDGGDGTKAGDRRIDAQPLSRGQRQVLDGFSGITLTVPG